MNELDKLKIGCVQFEEVYDTEYAKIEKYKHLRVTANSSEPVRIFVQWSYDGEEVCLENSIRLGKDKWQTEKLEVVAPYCRIRAMNGGSLTVERLVVNVLGRYQVMSGDVKKEVKYDMDEPPKPEPRHKSPFHRFVSHKKPVESQNKGSMYDPRLPQVMFKNSILYVNNATNSVNTFPFPIADGNQYVLTVRNNILDWKEANQL